MDIGASWPTWEDAEARVLRMQTKLHQWAVDDPDRRFDDLFNLVYDPAVLVVAWRRVRGNRGKRSGGLETAPGRAAELPAGSFRGRFRRAGSWQFRRRRSVETGCRAGPGSDGFTPVGIQDPGQSY